MKQGPAAVSRCRVGWPQHDAAPVGKKKKKLTKFVTAAPAGLR